MNVAADGSSVRKSSAVRLFFIMTALILVCAAAVIAIGDSDDSDASSTFTVDGIKYETTSDSTVKVISNSYSGSVTIPSSVTHSEVDYSVTSIGDYAFYGCTSLTSVTIGNSVTYIGSCAFYWCSSLTSVTIGNSVTSIGDHAFYYCTSLTSVTIGNSVTSIGDYAFYKCTSLTSVTIGNSVTSIGDYVFYGCTSLTEINVSENNENYCSVSGVLFNKEKTQLITYPAGRPDTSYTIPDSVTSIGGSAFCYCTSLTSVIIGNSVTSIGSYAFEYCTSLTSVTIGNSVTSIGDHAFYYCTSLTSVTIGNSVTSIGDYAFAGCSSLTSVTIGNSVTSIGDSAFALGKSTHNVVCYVYGCTDNKLDPYGNEYTSFVYNKLFEVAFMSQDGVSGLGTDAVQYGSDASYSGTVPSKQSDSQYTYTFAGWNSEKNKESAEDGILNNVTSDRTVYAAFSKSLKCTVTFVSQDGNTVLDTVSVPYGSNATYSGTVPSKQSDSQYTYTFVGWNSVKDQESAEDGILTNITADKTVYAAFSKTPVGISDSNDSSNIGVIIGIVVAAIVVIALIAVLVIKRKNRF